jgi:hypothetical protein
LPNTADSPEPTDGGQLVFPNVVLFVLRKAMDEEGPRARLEYDRGPKPARLSWARTSDQLLDHSAIKVGANQTSLGVPDRFAERGVTDVGLPRTPHECLCF